MSASRRSSRIPSRRPSGAQFDVKFTQSTDAGLTWTEPVVVNDNADPAASDQFQPSVAAGPDGGGGGGLL